MAGTMTQRLSPATNCCSVSMESGLDGRNNPGRLSARELFMTCLNGVRPRWPEQWTVEANLDYENEVSMESGLDGRNNKGRNLSFVELRDVSMESGLDGRNNYSAHFEPAANLRVSMESGLDGRNNVGGHDPLHHR